MKRYFDIIMSSVAIVGLAPVMLVVALLVRVKLGSPVLFRQERPGLRGRPFTMFKFRTMTDARDRAGDLLPDDRRLTAFGRFLRSASLDELPELVNVLRGEMSLVGPRPLLMSYLPLYTPQQARRHDVPPGVTGWAQVNGRNELPWDRRFDLDLWYIDHQSLGLDLKILWMTVAKVFRREGISQADHATMEPFRGSGLDGVFDDELSEQMLHPGG